MSGFVVVGTDTDAGKTAFSLLFLSAFADRYAYWKPVETGDSDSERVRRLAPAATVFPQLARFREPVAPALAARREGWTMPGVADVVAAVPATDRPLLIETFGGPLSPLSDDLLQVELLKALARPLVLVTSSAVGAVGRTMSTLTALRGYGLTPAAVALLGPDDEYAAEQIGRHGGVTVVSLAPPDGVWTPETLAAAAHEKRDRLAVLVGRVESSRPDGPAIAPLSVLEDSTRPTSHDLVARDAAVCWHPYQPLRPTDPPLPVVAAEAEFLHLADGRRVVDGISSWWTILHGHRRPELMAALRDATTRLDHVLFAGVTHPDAVAVSEALLGAMPWGGGGRVFFTDNGSTAVEVALKMSYQRWCVRGEPQRQLFVGFEGGYHGDTFGAMSVGRDPVFFGRFEPLLFRALRVPVDADALDAALSAHRSTAAGVIIEPLVQGAGGMRTHAPDVLRALHDVARNHGVDFIADEVMTGFGRTGSLFAFEQASIRPDLVCVAKGLTGGTLPLAATLASPDVVAAFDSPDPAEAFFHGHSFTANPLACAVAAASWWVLQTGRWKHDVDRIAAFWSRTLPAFAERRGVKAVRGVGLIGAVELDLPGGYLSAAGAAMRRACLARGVFLRPLGTVLYAMPPLCTSDNSLARIADAMRAAVDAALA